MRRCSCAVVSASVCRCLAAVLVFSGDVDACVPHTGTESWVRGLGYKVKQEWQPWLVNDQVAGYVVEYDADNQFTFLTIKGAGHVRHAKHCTHLPCPLPSSSAAC